MMGTFRKAAILITAMLLLPSHPALATCSTVDANEQAALAFISPAPKASIPTRSFGVRRDPITGSVVVSTEVRWRAPPGSSVRAASSGTVLSVSKEQTDYRIVVEHKKGLRSVYRGIGIPLVSVGACVEQLAELGRVSASQIAFSLTKEGRFLDPDRFIAVLSHKHSNRNSRK